MKLKFLIIINLIIQQAISSELFNNLNLYKWIYLCSLPAIYGQIAVKARVNAAKQSKQELNKPVIIENCNKDKQEKLTKQEELNLKYKDIITQKCLLCQAIKNIMYFTLLTYGASANLINRLSQKDPGTFMEITMNPIINAAVMYGISYIMDKRVRDELLFGE